VKNSPFNNYLIIVGGRRNFYLDIKFRRLFVYFALVNWFKKILYYKIKRGNYLFIPLIYDNFYLNNKLNKEKAAKKNIL